MTPALLDVAELSKRFPAGRPSGPIARLRKRFAGGLGRESTLALAGLSTLKLR